MKKINFLGVEFNVIDDDAIREAEQDDKHHHMYGVIRCADADPNGGSPDLRRRRIRTLCEDCRALCWLDPKSYEPTAHLEHTILCLQCIQRRKRAESKG